MRHNVCDRKPASASTIPSRTELLGKPRYPRSPFAASVIRERAMDASSGRNLRPFVAKRIYGEDSMLSLEASCREQDVVRPLTCLNRFPLPGSADAALYV
jgi:hypothetical protein